MIIGARGSGLAQVQARWVGERLARIGLGIEQQVIRTHGDQVMDRPLRDLGVQGVFTRELEEALLAGSIDLAVHSCKDVALDQPPGLALVAYTEREDPADLLVIRPQAHDAHALHGLKNGALVGSSSVRRCAMLRADRPDLRLRDLRGNVPTRLRHVIDGGIDATLLAAAGLNRLKLDLAAVVVLRLDPAHFVPAPAQGVLTVEMRADDPRLADVRACLNDPTSERAALLERALLASFGGGCSLPLGAWAQEEGDGWRLHGWWGGSAEGGPRLASLAGSGDDRHAAALADLLRSPV